MWIADAPDMPAPEAAMVCTSVAASRMPRPAPPSSVGMHTPSQPASVIAWWNSLGKPPSWSLRSQ